jgi:glycosyltransferase involved in cell wall biosynthesis
MRILELTWSSRGYGGIYSHVDGLCGSFLARGAYVLHRQMPWAGGRSEPADFDVDGDGDGDGGGLPSIGFRTALEAVVDRHDIELVHAHNLHGSRAPGIMAHVASVCATRSLPLILTIHDLPDRFIGLRDHVAESRHLFGDTYLVVTSAHNWNQAVRFFGRRPDDCIPPGIDFARFESTRAPDASTIAAPCRLAPGKGVLEALRGVGEYAEQAGPQSLLLSDASQESYGESDDYFTRLRDEQALQPLVRCEHLHGPGVIPGIYQRAQVVVVVPSRTEGFGLVALEGLAAGRPVVARPTGGMTWVRQVPGVYAIDEPTPSAIAEALRAVLSDLPEWEQSAAAACRRLKSRHDIGAVADRYQALFEKAISAGRRQPAAALAM